MENVKRIRRGDIYYTQLENIDNAVGSEQSGSRPAVVIQNDVGNKYSPTTIVAFITTQPKKCLPTHVRLHTKILFFSSTVMLEQIRTVSKDRLEKYIGTLSKSEIEKIDRAICVSLNIKETEKW